MPLRITLRIDNSTWWTIYNVQPRPYYFNEHTGISQWAFPYRDVWPQTHENLPARIERKRLKALSSWLDFGEANLTKDTHRVVDEKDGLLLTACGPWTAKCTAILLGDWDDRCRAFAMVSRKCPLCYLRGESVSLPYGEVKCLGH
jgi:hypothetical protein